MQSEGGSFDTAWQVRYKPILDNVVKATDDARIRMRSLKAVGAEKERLEAFADAHHIPDALLEQAFLFTKDYIANNGTVHPPEFLAQLRAAVPEFAQIVGDKQEIYGPLIRVAGLEVLLQGTVFSICGEYLDEEAERPKHAADSEANRDDFREFLHLELGTDKVVTVTQVHHYEEAIRKAICSELGISQTSARTAQVN